MINILFTLVMMVISLILAITHHSFGELTQFYGEFWLWTSAVCISTNLLQALFVEFDWTENFSKKIKVFNHLMLRISFFMFSLSFVFLLNFSTPMKNVTAEKIRVEKIQSQSFDWDRFQFFSWLPAKMTGRTSLGATVEIWIFAHDRVLYWPQQRLVLRTHEGPFLFSTIAKIESDEMSGEIDTLRFDSRARVAWQRLIAGFQESSETEQLKRYLTSYARAFPGDHFIVGPARWLIEQRQHETAIEVLSALQARFPQDIELLNLLGISYARLRQYSQGIPLLEKAAELSPRDYMAFYNLGYTYYYKGEQNQSVDYFRQVMLRRRNFPELQKLLNQFSRFPAQQELLRGPVPSTNVPR